MLPQDFNPGPMNSSLYQCTVAHIYLAHDLWEWQINAKQWLSKRTKMYHLTQAENVVCTASVGKVFILFPDGNCFRSRCQIQLNKPKWPADICSITHRKIEKYADQVYSSQSLMPANSWPSYTKGCGGLIKNTNNYYPACMQYISNTSAEHISSR